MQMGFKAFQWRHDDPAVQGQAKRQTEDANAGRTASVPHVDEEKMYRGEMSAESELEEVTSVGR